jgi:hypothetical protein
MSAHVGHHHTPWWVWPFELLFKALFHLITGILGLVLRFVAIVVGGVLALVGLLVSLTLIGAIVGIPLMLAGAWLMVRGVF